MAARLWFIWVTSLECGVDHAVTDEEMAAGRAENRGEYRALCGAVFLPAPSECVPRRPCPRCVRYMRARVSLRDAEDRFVTARRRGRHRRAGFWSRVREQGRRRHAG